MLPLLTNKSFSTLEKSRDCQKQTLTNIDSIAKADDNPPSTCFEASGDVAKREGIWMPLMVKQGAVFTKENGSSIGKVNSCFHLK
jgi:hypothetical protein